MVIVSGREMIEDIAAAPDDELSVYEAVEDVRRTVCLTRNDVLIS